MKKETIKLILACVQSNEIQFFIKLGPLVQARAQELAAEQKVDPPTAPEVALVLLSTWAAAIVDGAKMMDWPELLVAMHTVGTKIVPIQREEAVKKIAQTPVAAKAG